MIVELEEMMRAAQQKGLEERDSGRGGEGVRERGEGEEDISERNSDADIKEKTASISPPPVPLSRKFSNCVTHRLCLCSKFSLLI